MFMDHFPQAFDPLEIAHGKVSPGTLASGADETGIFIVSKGPGMNVEHLGGHADGKESFVFLHFQTSCSEQPGLIVIHFAVLILFDAILRHMIPDRAMLVIAPFSGEGIEIFPPIPVTGRGHWRFNGRFPW